MPRMSFDASGFLKEKDFAGGLIRHARFLAWRRVRAVSFTVERTIKLLMPVDTGRARASWGHSGPPAGAGEGVWIENDKALSVTQGSRVDYIEKLNAGHSKQAPAGFIDVAAEQGQQQLDRELEADLAGLFG